MSKRAFRPESLGPLEDRQLLSGAASQVHVQKPVAFSGVAFNGGALRIKSYLQQYGIGGNFQLLRTQIASVSTAIPFGRQDGLGIKTNAILDQLQQNRANHVPGAIQMADQQIMAGLKADVDARIANGTVVIINKGG